MKFSYSDTWDEAVRLLRANGSLVAAVAGAFLFLPSLLAGYFLPWPEGITAAGLAEAMRDYFDSNWPWMLLTNLVGMTGALAILCIVLMPGGLTVGGAIGRAFFLLPFYFAAMLLWAAAMILAGLPASLLGRLLQGTSGQPSPALALLILVLACAAILYVYGRTALIGPVLVAEDRRNPLAAFVRAFRLSAGRGWAIGLFIAMVFVGGFILNFALTSVARLAFLFAAGPEAGRLLSLILASALTSGLYALMTVLYAALYRRLAPSDPLAAPAKGS